MPTTSIRPAESADYVAVRRFFRGKKDADGNLINPPPAQRGGAAARRSYLSPRKTVCFMGYVLPDPERLYLTPEEADADPSNVFELPLPFDRSVLFLHKYTEALLIKQLENNTQNANIKSWDPGKKHGPPIRVSEPNPVFYLEDLEKVDENRDIVMRHKTTVLDHQSKLNKHAIYAVASLLKLPTKGKTLLDLRESLLDVAKNKYEEYIQTVLGDDSETARQERKMLALFRLAVEYGIIGNRQPEGYFIELEYGKQERLAFSEKESIVVLEKTPRLLQHLESRPLGDTGYMFAEFIDVFGDLTAEEKSVLTEIMQTSKFVSENERLQAENDAKDIRLRQMAQELEEANKKLAAKRGRPASQPLEPAALHNSPAQGNIGG